jgi:lysophospholipase L1-like esterase
MGGRLAARARAARRLPRAAAGLLLSAPHFERYVAIGDSSTEGLMDRDGAPGGGGSGGFVGWSRRLAQHVADLQGGLLYANLGVRGLTTREIRERQLAAALSLEPDLVSVFSGTNDVLRPRFDVTAFAADVHAIQHALRGIDATVITFTLPDLTPLLPWAAPLAGRIRAMNAAVHAACAATGTLLVDFATHPVTTDPRLWAPDRIHANSAGHARIAAALAQGLALPGTDAAWADPLPAPPRESLSQMVFREVGWAARYLPLWAVATLALWPAPPRPAKPAKLTFVSPRRDRDVNARAGASPS